MVTVSLISFLAFSPQILVLAPYFWNTPGVTAFDVLIWLVPFNLGVAAIFYNYYMVVFTTPGDVPDNWQPDWDSIRGVEVKASTGAPPVLQSLQQLQATQSAPLQDLQAMRAQDGPPLSLGSQLHWTQ